MARNEFDPGKRYFLRVASLSVGALATGAVLAACGIEGGSANNNASSGSQGDVKDDCVQVDFGDTALGLAGGYNVDVDIYRPDGSLKYTGPAVNAPGLFVQQDNGVNDPTRSDKLCK